MASKKNLQLLDLGLERRIEITTADDKRDPYARFTEKDLEGLRKSAQDPQTARLQAKDKEHLDAWSNFHQKVEMEEGVSPDEPQLMNGQSHRAHLHFDMRHKEGLVSKPSGYSHQTQAGRKRHLDPALDPGKLSFSKPKAPGLAPGLSRSLAGKPKEGPRFDRSKGLKVQRRPIGAPTKPIINTSPQNYEVKLADPGSWLNSVRNKTDQPGASALPPTSQVETTSNTKSCIEPHPAAIKPVVVTKPVATTQVPAVFKPVVKMPTNVTTKPIATNKSAGTTQTVATTSPIEVSKPVVTTQTNVTTASIAVTTTTVKPVPVVHPVATAKPAGTPKPVSKVENPFFGSNLPQPQTNSFTPRAQPQPAKNENLLLTFDSPPKKAGPESMKCASEPDMMELDDDVDKADSDTATSNVLKKKLAWIQELGFINDTLADFSLSDSKQVKQLEERRKKLQGMIHAASNQKIIKPQQITSRPEKLIELSPTPLQKAVTARPFVPPPKPTFHKVNAPVTGGLQASRWADPDVDMVTTPKESPKKTFNPKRIADSDDTVDYWQKTLPKLRPLPVEFTKHDESPASTSTSDKKPTKSIYESRYAC